MTKDECKKVVIDIIADIAPDEDLSALKPDVRLRDQLQLAVRPVASLVGMGVIAGCTTLVSLIPSFLAARLKPVTAMSQVG